MHLMRLYILLNNLSSKHVTISCNIKREKCLSKDTVKKFAWKLVLDPF